MIKSSMCISVFLALAWSSTAQVNKETIKTGWRITSATIDYGQIKDKYSKMDLETMYDFTKNPELLDRDLSGYSESLFRESEGIKIGASIILSSGRLTGNWEHEARLGALYSNREPFILYSKGTIETEMHTIIYCNVVNEFSLDGAYILRRKNLKHQWLSFYTGLGLNLGATINNELVVMDYSYDSESAFSGSENEGITMGETTNGEESYDAKESVISRLYIPLGVQVSFFDKVSLGLESNMGIGFQSMIKGKTYFTRANTGLVVKLGYNF